MKKPKSPTETNSKSNEDGIFLNKLFEEIMEQVIKASKGHRNMESYILGWSTIEQFLLPDLINLISLKLKVQVPKNMAEIQAATLIKLYYFLSHDKELYDSLEKARKTRNSLVHKLNKHENWNDLNKGFKIAIKNEIAPLYALIVNRYEDYTLIPVLNLYKKGWNDRTKTIEDGFKLINDIASGKA